MLSINRALRHEIVRGRLAGTNIERIFGTAKEKGRKVYLVFVIMCSFFYLCTKIKSNL